VTGAARSVEGPGPSRVPPVHAPGPGAQPSMRPRPDGRALRAGAALSPALLLLLPPLLGRLWAAGTPAPASSSSSLSPGARQDSVLGAGRVKRGWVWNQFFVVEEYTGTEPLYVGKVRWHPAPSPRDTPAPCPQVPPSTAAPGPRADNWVMSPTCPMAPFPVPSLLLPKKRESLSRDPNPSFPGCKSDDVTWSSGHSAQNASVASVCLGSAQTPSQPLQSSGPTATLSLGFSHRKGLTPF
jgi:hypothetical protein